MRICFYCDSIFSFGGVQRVLAVIAKALASNHEITILTHDSPALEDLTMYELNESVIEFQYINYPPLPRKEYLPCKTYSYLYKKLLPHTALTSRWYGRSSFPSSQRKQLITQLNEGKYDVVVGVHAFLSLRLATIREQLNARLTVGWMHNSFQAFFENRPAYLGGLKSHFTHQMKRLDKVIVLTHTDQRLYGEQLNLSPTVVYNPLTLNAHERCRPEAKKFLAVGRFSSRHKGFDILIEGFALFARENADWTLDIVGEGPEEGMIRRLIGKHGLQQRVQIHPFTKQIQTYYAASSVYVLSSRWEGFGLVLLEAMAHGLPIISSDIPTSTELLGKTNFCSFFANEDSLSLSQQMLAISRQPASVLAAWGDEAMRETEHYSIDNILCEWEKLLLPKIPKQ